MRIAILNRYQNSANRGLEAVVSELVERLSKNHQVDVYSGNDADNFFKVISGNYDIIMPTNGRGQSLKFSLGRLFKKYKLVIGGHSGIGKDDIWNIVVGKPEVFIALTDHMARWAKKWAWGSKVVKINNGIDLEKFKPTGEKMKVNLEGPIILSVGALSWYKYHDRTIKAVSRLEKGSLLIVGNGEDKEKLEELGKKELGERFKITSAPYKDLPKIYRASDVFTLPSWDSEAFGVVYLEAMATGLPVVAPDDLVRKEIVGEGGCLVDTADTEKFARGLKEALSKKWGELPRKQAEKFSWEKIAREYERCFENILS